MSVQNQIPFNSYTANGATTVFPFTFMLLESGDLIVELDGVEQTTGFTVSGIGASGGGDVTFTSAPTNGTRVLLIRVLTLQRLTDYQDNGDLLAVTLNNDFDRIWQSLQQVQQNVIRSMKLPIGTSTDQVIPDDAATRANKGIKFDASGNLKLTDHNIDEAQTTAAAAATSAAGSATDAENSASSAALSAAAAAASESAAAASESAAAASESAAAASESAAAASESAAAASESAAAASESAASASASAAALDAAAAADSESAAAASESAAAISESNAAASASAAQAAADSVIWNDVVFKTSADSPISITDSDAGKLFAIDCSGGAVTVNLPQISGLTLSNPWSVGLKKTEGGANAVTINRAGTDTIDGGTTAAIASASGLVLIPDTDPSPDAWTSMVFGATTELPAAASQAEMEAGTEAALRSMSPLRVAQAIAELGGGGSGFPSTTAMLFVQTSAPTGWTKSTTHNDKALRIVSGEASSGGTSAFSTVFGKTATNSYTLTTTDIPSHNHAGAQKATQVQNSDVSGYNFATTATTTGNTGGGGGHSHGMDIRVQYVDTIIATKD